MRGFPDATHVDLTPYCSASVSGLGSIRLNSHAPQVGCGSNEFRSLELSMISSNLKYCPSLSLPSSLLLTLSSITLPSSLSSTFSVANNLLSCHLGCFGSIP